MQYWTPDNTGLRYCNFQSPCEQAEPTETGKICLSKAPGSPSRGGGQAEDEERMVNVRCGMEVDPGAHLKPQPAASG